MSINKIPQVYCSLNLGLIYDLSYSYMPKEGVRISLFFTNESGVFNVNAASILSASKKVNITIGSASFNLYAISYKLLRSVGRKILQVNFVDETFKLENYQIVLTGRGCGINVIQLGKTVQAGGALINGIVLDPLMQNADVEYKFSDFLYVLNQYFPVNGDATYDNSLTRTFTGTFKEVLENWCAFYNLSYYFENSVIQIIDRATLNIVFPAQTDVPMALSYDVEETIENTYCTTAYSYLLKEGRKIDANLIKTVDLYPIDNGSNLNESMNSVFGDIAAQIQQVQEDFTANKATNPQNQAQYTVMNINLLQVAAAMYGQEYWFLYNYYNGTATAECGWTPQTALPTFLSNPAGYGNGVLDNSTNPPTNLGPALIGIIDKDIFEKKFEMYSNYGKKIAGRYYLSLERTDVDDNKYQWFDNTTQDTSFAGPFASNRKLQTTYLTQGTSLENSVNSYLPGTFINEYFPGVQYVGNHILYIDNSDRDFIDAFALTPVMKNLIQGYYKNLFEGFLGSDTMDYTALGPQQQYVIYANPIIDQTIISSFNNLTNKITIFTPTFNTLSVIGQLKQNEPNVVTYPPFPAVNLTTIQPVTLPSYRYNVPNLQLCVTEASDGDVFKRNFISFSVSNDVPVGASLNAINNQTSEIARDTSILNNYLNKQILKDLAQLNTIPLKTVSFTLNYFYTVPTNFISSGLTSINMEVSENGILAKYVYSNSMIQRIVSEAAITKLEQMIKNSWIRQNTPDNAQISQNQ